MRSVGIRVLKQNPSAVVADAAAGEEVIITDRGRPVAQIGPLAQGRIAQLVAAGRARPSKSRLSDVPAPAGSVSARLSSALVADRANGRY